MKNNIISIVIITLFLFTIGCNDHISPTLPLEETQTPTQEHTAVPVIVSPTPQPTICISGNIEYETINTFNFYLLEDYRIYGDPVCCVARTYEECALLMGEDFAKTIDFSKKILIGVFDPLRFCPSICNSVKITNVTTDCNKITVHVLKEYRAICATVCGQGPIMHVITINKTSLPVEFDIIIKELTGLHQKIQYTLPEDYKISFEDISSDLVYNCNNHSVHVINSESEFNAVFNNSSCLVKKPFIDFSKKTLISIFMGESPDSCYSTEIFKIYKDFLNINIHILENYGPCMRHTCLTAITHPQQHILIDKASLPVNYKYLDFDSDFDGYTDRVEYLAGTNRCDRTSHP